MMGLSNEMMVMGVFLVFGIIWAGHHFFKWVFEDGVTYPWKQRGGCGDQVAELYKNGRSKDLLGELLEAGKRWDEQVGPTKDRILWPEDENIKGDLKCRLGEDKDLDAARVREKPIGETSDGYHTFNELYKHRHMLFIALMISDVGWAWRSRLHDDGTALEGWFVAGIELSEDVMITYHLPDRLWDLLDAGDWIDTLNRAPAWDGHTSDDVLKRLRDHIESNAGFPRCGGHE